MINLLIVDDDKSLCAPIKKFFEEKKYNVSVEHNGENALKTFKAIRPHLVFLDVDLPDISGMDLLKIIKEIDDTTKVIMITGYDSKEHMEQARNYGVSEYLVKPFTLEYLQEEGIIKVQMQLFEELRQKHEKEHKIRNIFQRYVPEDVVNTVLENSESMFEGKKAKVTVLICDIINSTSFTRRLSPEEVVRLLNSYFREMAKPIYMNGGVIDKYMGDAIMGVFGAPVAKNDDAKNAVLAAWDMIARLGRFNADNADKYGNISIGIGINTGEVIAGNIGFEKKMEYTVIGDTVHKVSEIEVLSKNHPNQILIGGSTYDEVKNIVKTEDLGHMLPGREKESVFKVTGLNAGL
ncbi:MAG: adenylate/guanylate cyclase domain-containing response regulator [Elusimicrobia bacterium]|nr:adenylate/guanylate cyclase domain-containing response regulator [Elusimicrobiota bacterium]